MTPPGAPVPGELREWQRQVNAPLGDLVGVVMDLAGASAALQVRVESLESAGPQLRLARRVCRVRRHPRTTLRRGE
jgi:hypothetical protein